MYAWARCAVVCFELAKSLDAVMKTTLMLRGAHLHWSYLGSAICAKCKRLDHTSLGCGLGKKLPSGRFKLVIIYAKCLAPVTWLASVVGGFSFPPLSGQSVSSKNGSSSEMKPTLLVSLVINDRFATFECSLTSLTEHVNKLAKRLDTPGPMNQEADIVMSEDSGVATSGKTVVGVTVFDSLVVLKMKETLKNLSVTVISFSAKLNNTSLVPIAGRFDGVWVFTSGLDSGYLNAGMVIVMDSFLVRHVYKISEVLDWLLYIKLFFKNKLSVSILGLYASTFSVVWFFQASEINSLIAKAVNKTSFIILSSDFNENGSYKCASFKKCLDLGLVYSLVRSLAAKTPTWANSRGVKKTIDYVFISPNLINAVVYHDISDVSKHFDTDYQAVSVSLELGRLLNTYLISFYKQFEFKNNITANAVVFSDAFDFAVRFLDLDAMWDIIHKIIVLSVDSAFKKKWFKSFNGVFTKEFSRFYKLELLVSKLNKLDSTGTSAVKFLFLLGSNFNLIHSVLVKTRKLYHTAKLLESKCTEKSYIKLTIAKKMKSFELDKGHIIRSVLERSFHKMVLDHLIVEDELILEPNLVKSKMNEIMVGWTRKHKVVSDLSANWICQFQSLDYVFDGVFSGVICLISLNKMSAVVKNFPNRKTAGLSDAWVSMISKPYKWEGVLMNTHPIALIKTACKIFSKVLSDRISLSCSAFDVLCGDNFSVLKGTMT
ncbi:hypothetical protein G9A89_007145 [Geosiphon pyriformis]|nr:hypothetical protein G9A89_007145 [Geosiphon pyriformis]